MHTKSAAIGMLAAVLLLGISGVALAGDGGFGNTTQLEEKVKEIGGFLLKIVFLGFLIVGGYVIVTSLAEAKKNGGWGHVVVGLLMVFIAGIALWTISSMANQDPDRISESIKVQR